jgi:hypothetical protein
MDRRLVSGPVGPSLKSQVAGYRIESSLCFEYFPGTACVLYPSLIASDSRRGRQNYRQADLHPETKFCLTFEIGGLQNASTAEGSSPMLVCEEYVPVAGEPGGIAHG